MKLIHTSDLHLDSPFTARLSPTEAKDRRRELTDAFRRMIDEALLIEAEAIIIAGDLFDSQKVGVRTLDSVMGIIENANISFLYLAGNHEKNRLISSGVSIPENLKIFGEGWTYFKLGELTVAGRSKIEKNMFSTLSLNSDEKNIVVLHGELSEHSESPDKIGVDALSRLPIDYLALGHYHTYSKTKINERTVAVYSGTPEGRGFDETGEKGYVIIDTGARYIDAKFVKRAKRTLHAIEVNVGGAVREIEIEDRISASLSGVDREDLVRIKLVGEHEPGSTRDVESLKERFRSSYFYFEVIDESRLKISAEDYKNDKSLKGEFIRLVMSKEELTDDEKNAIIECGIRALAGETI